MDRVFEPLNRALSSRADGLRDVDELTVARLMVREFVYVSATHPQLHRVIVQLIFGP